MKKSVIYNTAAQLFAKFVSMSLTVAITMLITRMFGKEAYGQFSLMQTLPALFYILTDFGFNTTALKRIGDNASAQEHYRTVLSMRLILSALFIIALNITTLFLPYSIFLKTGIFLSSFMILTQALYSSTNLVFQYKQRYDLSAIGYISGSLLTIALVGIFIKFGLDIRFLSFAYVLGGLLTFAVNAGFIKRWIRCASPLFNIKLAKRLLAGSLSLGLMFIFSQINFKADTILLSLLKLPSHITLTNIESVAVYSLPYKVFEVALVLPTFMMNAIYPLFVSKIRQGQKEFTHIFLRTFKYMASLGLVSSVALYIFAPLVVNVLGGDQFTQSTEVLRVLSLGLFIFFLTQPIAYFIVTLDKQKYLPAVYLVSAVFNVGANLIFIPKYSFYASAYITWFSEALILLMLIVTAIKAWREYPHTNA